MDPRPILAAIMCLIFAICMVIYGSRKHIFPIKGSDPFYMMTVSALLIISYVNFIFVMSWYPCAVKVWVWVFAMNGVFIFYKCRFLRIIFRTHIHQDMLEIFRLKKIGRSGDSLTEAKGWHLRHHSWTSPSVLLCYIIVDFGFTLAYLIASTLKDPEMSLLERCDPIPSTNLALRFLIATFYLRIIFLAILHYKERHLPGFLMTENRFVFSIVFITATVQVCLYYNVPSLFNDTPIHLCLNIIAAFSLLLLGFVRPIYLSLIVPPKPPIPLSNVIQSEEGFKAFCAFLSLEFSVAPLLFYRDVDLFLKAYDIKGSTPVLESSHNPNLHSVPLLQTVADPDPALLERPISMPREANTSFSDQNLLPPNSRPDINLDEVISLARDISETYLQESSLFFVSVEPDVHDSVQRELNKKFKRLSLCLDANRESPSNENPGPYHNLNGEPPAAIPLTIPNNNNHHSTSNSPTPLSSVRTSGLRRSFSQPPTTSSSALCASFSTPSTVVSYNSTTQMSTQVHPAHSTSTAPPSNSHSNIPTEKVEMVNGLTRSLRSASQQVYNILNDDAFPRFMASTHYRKHRHEIPSSSRDVPSSHRSHHSVGAGSSPRNGVPLQQNSEIDSMIRIPSPKNTKTTLVDNRDRKEETTYLFAVPPNVVQGPYSAPTTPTHLDSLPPAVQRGIGIPGGPIEEEEPADGPDEVDSQDGDRGDRLSDEHPSQIHPEPEDGEDQLLGPVPFPLFTSSPQPSSGPPSPTPLKVTINPAPFGGVSPNNGVPPAEGSTRFSVSGSSNSHSNETPLATPSVNSTTDSDSKNFRFDNIRSPLNDAPSSSPSLTLDRLEIEEMDDNVDELPTPHLWKAPLRGVPETPRDRDRDGQRKSLKGLSIVTATDTSPPPGPVSTRKLKVPSSDLTLRKGRLPDKRDKNKPKLIIPSVEGGITFLPSSDTDVSPLLPRPELNLSLSPQPSVPVYDEEEKKSKQKLSRALKECTELLPFLFVAGQPIAEDLTVLKSCGITHIVNCARDACPNYHPDNFTYFSLHLLDSPDEDLMSLLYDIIEFIEEARLKGGRILVHCQQGASRSPAVCIGYLMLLRDEGFQFISNLVKQHRSISRPNLNFSCQLIDWRKRISGTDDRRAYLYRIAPHSVRDTVLVGKWVDKIVNGSLDARGVFVLHSPTLRRIYVYVGAACKDVQAYVKVAKKLIGRLQKYEHAPNKVEYIYANLVPMTPTGTSQSTVALFWQTIGTGPDGGLARPFNPDYDKEYGDPSNFTFPLPPIPRSSTPLIKKDLLRRGYSGSRFEIKTKGARDRGTSVAEKPVGLSARRWRRRRSSTGSVTLTDPRPVTKRSDSVDMSKKKKPVKVFQYPDFRQHILDKKGLLSENVYVVIGHPQNQTPSAPPRSLSNPPLVTPRNSGSPFFSFLSPSPPLPTVTYLHVWIGKTFSIPESWIPPSRKSQSSSGKTPPIQPSPPPAPSFPLSPRGREANRRHWSALSGSFVFTIAAAKDGSPISARTPSSSSDDIRKQFATYIGTQLQSLVRLRDEKTEFITVYEEEGRESSDFLKIFGEVNEKIVTLDHPPLEGENENGHVS